MEEQGLVPIDGFNMNRIENNDTEQIELFSDYGEIEQLSDEAKSRQEQAIMAAKEKAMSIIDRKKLPLAIKEINGLEMAVSILDDSEIIERVKGNIKSTMDLKFLAEFEKLKLQNIQTLLRMDSINENGTAGEVSVGIDFCDSGGGHTRIVVGKK